MTEFTKNVIANIRKVPPGKVATYAQIAELSGKPHAARAVSWILHSSSEAYGLPWQRILNSKGKISFPWGSRHYNRQKTLLKKEGVVFSSTDDIDMKHFQWKKKPARTRKARTVRSSIAD